VIAGAPRTNDDLINSREISKAAHDRRDGAIKGEIEPFFRRAFEALKAGRTQEYRDMVCL